jgi:aspartyl-tRNA(Asn)/glutamyl-tRNA(Gln) amidotransferase subunit B
MTDYERRRHVAHYLANPDTPVRQETRGFNESLGKTHTLRTKEDAEDYRYMPDPNLPPMVIADVSGCSTMMLRIAADAVGYVLSQVYLDRLAMDLPELPDTARQRLATEYGVTHTDVDTLLGLDEFHGQGIDYFEAVVKGTGKTDKLLDGKKAVNW